MADLRELVTSDNNIELLRNVLAEEMDLNVKDNCGDTLLHTAVKSFHDNPETVQELINAGADVCRLDLTTCTVLHHAVMRGKRKVVDVLLQTEIPINHKNHLGITALHYSINRNASPFVNFPWLVTDMHIVRKLLNHSFIKVNEMDNFGQTPLVYAIKKKHFEIVKLLLNKNAEIEGPDINGYTPLRHALYNCSCPIVIALLLKRANLFYAAVDGQSPLNHIINLTSVEFACKCLKVIAFNYSLKELLKNKLKKSPELRIFLNKCWTELDYMKNDIIANKLTVFDFFSKCDTKHVFDNPILQIYKPVVKKLLSGIYPKYLGYILNRMSKSTLHAVLEVYINERYFNKPCVMEYFAEFSKIIQSHLLFEYLSNEEIFCLIVAFTDKLKNMYLLDFHENEWYLNNLWDVYPDDHFC